MTVVDARGLLCPLPLALARRRMDELRAGDELVVLASDPEAAIDLAAWATEDGHAITERRRSAWSEFVLTKGGAAP